MPFSDHQSISGVLHITLRDQHGAILEERRVRNLITRDGKLLLAGLFTGKVDAGVSLAIAVGSSAAAPAETDSRPRRPRRRRPRHGRRDQTVRVRRRLARPRHRRQRHPQGHPRRRLGQAAAGGRHPGAQQGPGHPPILFNHVTFPVISKGGNVEMTLSWEITL
jgi:hypothetical protein